MKNVKTPIKSLISMAAMMFVITVLFTASFAQSNDRDGDGVIDRDDACPDIKGTKANQGCPDKNEKIVVEAPAGCLSGDCVSGKGKLNAENGDIYEGNFVNSLYHGVGLLTYPDGSTYQGFFATGKREGTGVLKLKSGKNYTGNFANDKINGFGILTLPNGDGYVGDFVNNNREGQGTFTWKDGASYGGEWKNDKYNGKGKFYDKQSNTFQEGLWKDNVLVEAVKANNTEANSTATLEQTILQIIADGENEFSKYIGEKLPKSQMLSTVQNSKYGLTLGGFREYISENSVAKLITYRSNFDAKNNQQIDQSKNVKAAIDKVVKQNGYTVQEESYGTYINNNKSITVLSYHIKENGMLSDVSFHSTSKRAVDRVKELDGSMAADQKNPALLELTARLGFQDNSNGKKELNGTGFRKILKEFSETFQAAKTGIDKKTAIEKYIPLAIKELKVVETNYQDWEVFLSNAKTLTAQQIAEDRKTIESEKAFVVKGLGLINSLTKQ